VLEEEVRLVGAPAMGKKRRRRRRRRR